MRHKTFVFTDEATTSFFSDFGKKKYNNKYINNCNQFNKVCFTFKLTPFAHTQKTRLHNKNMYEKYQFGSIITAKETVLVSINSLSLWQYTSSNISLICSSSCFIIQPQWSQFPPRQRVSHSRLQFKEDF